MKLKRAQPGDGGKATPRRTLFLEFTTTFAIIALLLTAAAGFAVSRYMADDMRDRAIEDAARFVEEVVSKQVAASLTAEQMVAPLTSEAYEQLDSYIQASVLNPQIVRINIWHPEGILIYSSDEKIHGGIFPVSDEVKAALAGRTVTSIESPARADHIGLDEYGRLLEVHTPLRLDDAGLVGVLEVYRNYDPILAQIRAHERTVYIGIAATLGALYLALVFIVRRGSNTMRRQQANLQAQAEELRNSYESIVSVLCSALDLRDHVTHGHAQRVSELASVVAWQLGLRKEEVRRIEKAAILHDIGKIGVADAVLSKPGALNEEEWAEMKRHPELGYQILQGIDFLKDVADIVYAHHERFDGNGYPRGLKGEESPLGARIFAVVDAYDAMTSQRPYRKAMPHSKAVQEIARNSGTQFDPQVVKAFLEADRRGLLEGNHADNAAELVPSRARIEA